MWIGFQEQGLSCSGKLAVLAVALSPSLSLRAGGFYLNFQASDGKELFQRSASPEEVPKVEGGLCDTSAQSLLFRVSKGQTILSWHRQFTDTLDETSKIITSTIPSPYTPLAWSGRR